MSAIKYQKNDRSKLGEYFSVAEFECNCSSCDVTWIDPVLVARLDVLRGLIKLPVRITSGYRCLQKQEELRKAGYETAVGISQHTLGGAADISVIGKTGAELEPFAKQAGFKSIGVGKNFLHVDIRDDKERRWDYK